MNKLIRYELLKLCKNRIYCTLILVLIGINLPVFYLNLRSALPASHTFASYRAIIDELNSREDAGAYLTEETESALVAMDFYRYDNFREIGKEYDQIASYQEYLKNIKRQSLLITKSAIFSQPGTFSYRNALATEKAFEPLSDVVPVLDYSSGINAVSDNIFSDMAAVLAIFLTVVFLVLREKATNITALLKTTVHGRTRSLIAKVIAVFSICFLITIILQMSNIVLAGSFCGLGDLSRPLQSVYQFGASVIEVSVIQYLIMLILGKFFTLFAFSMILFAIAIISRRDIPVFVVSFIIGALSGVGYLLISEQSYLNIFKHINLVGFLHFTPILKRYMNVNLFGFPINLLWIYGVLIITALTVGSLISVRTYSVQRNLGYRNFTLIKRRQWKRIRDKSSIILFELKKSLLVNKAALILMGFGLLQLYYGVTSTYYLDTDDMYYMGYMKVLSGPATLDKETYFQREQERFDDLRIQISDLSDRLKEGTISEENYQFDANMINHMLYPERIFQQISDRYEFIRKSGRPLHLLFDKGYKELFQGFKNADLKLLAILMLIMIPIYTYEYQSGMDQLIRSTMHGRGRTAGRKLMSAGCMAFITGAITYLPELVRVDRTFKFPELTAPVASIPEYDGVKGSIIGFITAVLLLRLLAVVLAMVFILFISCVVKTALFSFVINVGVLVLPVLLQFSGIRIIRYLPLNMLISGEQLLIKGYVTPQTCGYIIGSIVLISIVGLFNLQAYSKGRIKLFYR
ncbi:MAG: hypothetical protein K0S76_966 [Herbinix sp.]|jgi:hypothetical protein|nr:hypothetical protein [Herbinix sp.]